MRWTGIVNDIDACVEQVKCSNYINNKITCDFYHRRCQLKNLHAWKFGLACTHKNNSLKGTHNNSLIITVLMHYRCPQGNRTPDYKWRSQMLVQTYFGKILSLSLTWIWSEHFGSNLWFQPDGASEQNEAYVGRPDDSLNISLWRLNYLFNHQHW